MKKTLAPSLVLVLALLAFTAVASAYSLPKPATSKVVVPTSIAGVKLGMSEAKAKSAWGSARGHCETFPDSRRTRCEYGDTTGPSGSALIEFGEGKVLTVVVYSGKNSANKIVPSAAGTFEQMTTGGGIGIGSKYSEVKAAFPKGQVVETGSDAFNYSLKGKGSQEFNIGILAASKKVYALAVTESLVD